MSAFAISVRQYRVRVGVVQQSFHIQTSLPNPDNKHATSLPIRSTHLSRNTTNTKDGIRKSRSLLTATIMSHEFSTTIKQHGSLPWDSAHMVLGAGYDMATRETLPSPFETVDVEDSYSTETFPQVDVQTQVFRDEQELSEHLWSMASASSPSSSLASVKSMASYIKTTKCNAENACLVLRCTLSMPPEHFDDELDVTDTGRQMLNSNPQKFIDSYGEYCITGYIRQSSFFAVCTYSSTNAEELDKFTSMLGASGSSDKSGIDVASDLVKGTKSHSPSIRESHKFNISGVEGEVGLSWLENATVTEAWQGFRFDYKPVPQIAILKHYSSILAGEIPRPTRSHEVSWHINEAVWKCALLQMATRSKSAQQHATIVALSTISERLDVLCCSNNEATVVEVKEIISKLDDMRNQARRPARPAIKAELEALADSDKKRCVELVHHHTSQSLSSFLTNLHRDEWSHGPFESCGEDTWTFGISPARAADLGIATDDIQTSTKTCRLPDTGSLVCQKPEPIRHELPGRVIIGAKLKNRYADPREGGKWKRVGGWLGRETFSIKVETRHTRGCDWELIVWSVPRSLYEG